MDKLYPLHSLQWACCRIIFKSYYLKIDPTFNILKLGHKVDDMLSKVKELEPSLLTSYNLRSAVYEKFMQERLVPFEESADPEYEEYIKNQEMYWVSKYLLDLKYLGTIHKSLPETFSILVMPCNPYWLHFFIELRTFLNWPIQGQFFDYISQSLENPCINNNQLIFLATLNKRL